MASGLEVPRRKWRVVEEQAGAPLDRVVRAELGECSWGQARRLITAGYVLVDGQITLDPAMIVSVGIEVCLDPKPSSQKRAPEALSGTPGRSSLGAAAANSEGAAAANSDGPALADRKPPGALVLFQDSQVVVVNKPSGVSTEPHDASEKNTLDRRLSRALSRGGRRGKVFVVHRLDKETTGVLVFARTHEAQERLKSQFRFHTTERRYLAIVHGHPKELTYRSNLVVNRGDGLRGSTENANLGKESVTHIEVLERFAQASLIRCRLETGRTHQIRIHLSEAGHPLLGERVYTRGFSGRQLSAPRVMLHAASLGFDHPLTGARITHELPLPADMADVLLRLRRGAST